MKSIGQKGKQMKCNSCLLIEQLKKENEEIQQELRGLLIQAINNHNKTSPRLILDIEELSRLGSVIDRLSTNQVSIRDNTVSKLNTIKTVMKERREHEA